MEASELKKRILTDMKGVPVASNRGKFKKLYREVKKLLEITQKEAYLLYELSKAMEIEYRKQIGQNIS